MILYLAGFALGIIFVNLVWEHRSRDLEALTVFRIQGDPGVRGSGYLCYLIRRRLGVMLLYPLPGLTALGGYLVLAGLLWTGFLGGVLSAMAVLQLGVRGLLFLSAAVLPQALIYVPASLFYLTAVYRMSEKSRLAGGPERKKYREYFLACGAGMALVLCGVFLECYVNPMVLRWVSEL